MSQPSLPRPLPRPVAPVEMYLAAVVERLDQLTAAVRDMSARVGTPTRADIEPGEESTVRLLEPDTGPGPNGRLAEPDIPEPPRYGKGSGRPAWVAYADRLGVTYPPGAGQRDIIAAVDAAKT